MILQATLPLYSVFLIVSQIPFLLAVFWDYCKHLKGLILIGCFFGVICISATLSTLTTPPTPNAAQPPTQLRALQAPNDQLTKFSWSDNQIETEITALLFLEEQQPTNQETLYSLAVLHLTQGNTQESLRYYELSRAVNPLSPLFARN